MALLKIARMGDPVLARIAEAVPDPTARDVRHLLDDMYETMTDADGTGLAAPQVHVPKRVMLFMAERGDPDDETVPATEFAPLTALINPKWRPLAEDMAIGWEGCLSVPGLTGAVRRFTHIEYEGYSPDGALVKREATGFHARVFQHEFDHLDGILYPARMEDLGLLVFTEEAQRHGLPRLAGAPEDSPEDIPEEAEP